MEKRCFSVSHWIALGIEIQMFMSLGLIDINDLLFNLLEALIGYGVVVIFWARINKKEKAE